MRLLIRLLRSIFGVAIGLFLISIIVESIEVALVGMLGGESASTPAGYYAVRNQPWLLAVKLLYNTGAAIIGGFVAALIAGYAPLRHGLALAIVQTLAFLWALSQPAMRQWTPLWVWIALIVVSFAGIMFGAKLRAGFRKPPPEASPAA